MKHILIITLILLTLFGCQKIDTLNDSDKIDLIPFIIKEHTIGCLYNKPIKVNNSDSLLYYISLYPERIQKVNRLNPFIDFNKIFKKDDIVNYENQIKSFDTTLEYNHIIKSDIHFFTDNDTILDCQTRYYISYPLFNSKKNALIVYLSYYSGPLSAGDMVLFYVKRFGKWDCLEKIMLSIS